MLYRNLDVVPVPFLLQGEEFDVILVPALFPLKFCLNKPSVIYMKAPKAKAV